MQVTPKIVSQNVVIEGGGCLLDAASLRALEEALLDPSVRRSRERLSELIADDFLEFGASGRVYTKRDVLEASDRLPDVLTPLDEFEVTVATADVALVTYRSTIRRGDGTSAVALRSSLWALRDGRWQIRFHQGTPAGASPDQSASD